MHPGQALHALLLADAAQQHAVVRHISHGSQVQAHAFGASIIAQGKGHGRHELHQVGVARAAAANLHYLVQQGLCSAVLAVGHAILGITKQVVRLQLRRQPSCRHDGGLGH